MHFSFAQAVPGRVEAVIDALLDPKFVARLGELPKLGTPEVVDQRRDGDTVVQRVHHTFSGSLSPAVTRVVDPSKLQWIIETTYDLRAGRATFRIIPDHYAGKLKCSGTYVFTDDGQTTKRRADGDVSIGVPLVGRIVERAIVSGLEEHMAAEGDLLATWLEDNH